MLKYLGLSLYFTRKRKGNYCRISKLLDQRTRWDDLYRDSSTITAQVQNAGVV
jgi:hypothetical protein